MWSARHITQVQCTTKSVEIMKYLRTDILNAVYFRRRVTCTLGLTNDLVDSGQPRAKKDFFKCALASLYVDGV